MSSVEDTIKYDAQTDNEEVDYKMVTFSLAGKDYGFDIMKVAEISKANRFTFVPNSAPYVRGVYNLRGDIISIIDLRIMFHLPAERKENNGLEDLIILNLNDYPIGVIVDSIDKVVGLSSETIQPPHPIFGDINIKFMEGVVEHNDKLYLILDAEIALGASEDEEDESCYTLRAASAADETKESSVSTEVERNLTFISETLLTFKNFTVTGLNKDWAISRLEELKSSRNITGDDFQLTTREEVDEFIAPFFSPCTGKFWTDEYCSGISNVLPDTDSGTFNVWNPGCGKGYETFSFLSLLCRKYAKKSIKIWANDNDLLSISTAPGLIFQENDVPKSLLKYTIKVPNGLKFSTDLTDLVLFEYHDIFNQNPFPNVDLILARDIVSFQNGKDQKRLLDEFSEKIKPGGILILGQNEYLEDDAWESIKNGNVVVFRKKNG